MLYWIVAVLFCSGQILYRGGAKPSPHVPLCYLNYAGGLMSSRECYFNTVHLQLCKQLNIIKGN